MIEIVQGKIGAGKTYHAVERCFSRLAAGSRCYTNIEFKRDAVRDLIRARYGREFEDDRLIDLPARDEVVTWWEVVPKGTLKDPILVVLDEASLFYNSREWSENSKKDTHKIMYKFLRQSRKVGNDVIFITQEMGSIDKQMREQAEFIVTCKNFARIGIPVVGWLLKGLRLVTRREAQSDQVMDQKWRRWDTDLFYIYDTTALLDDYMNDLMEDKETLTTVALGRCRFLDRVRAWFSVRCRRESFLSKWHKKFNEVKKRYDKSSRNSFGDGRSNIRIRETDSWACRADWQI